MGVLLKMHRLGPGDTKWKLSASKDEGSGDKYTTYILYKQIKTSQDDALKPDCTRK